MYSEILDVSHMMCLYHFVIVRINSDDFPKQYNWFFFMMKV